jgi:MFS family permease
MIRGVVSLAHLMVVLDATVVTIALPSAQRDLGFTNDSRQWIVTAVALALGSLLLVGGRFTCSGGGPRWSAGRSVSRWLRRWPGSRRTSGCW